LVSSSSRDGILIDGMFKQLLNMLKTFGIKVFPKHLRKLMFKKIKKNPILILVLRKFSILM